MAARARGARSPWRLLRPSRRDRPPPPPRVGAVRRRSASRRSPIPARLAERSRVAVSQANPPRTTDGPAVLYVVRAVALIVAVAAAVAAFRPTIVVILAAAVTAGLFAWRHRDRHLP